MYDYLVSRYDEANEIVLMLKYFIENKINNEI